MRVIRCEVPRNFNLFLAGDFQWGNAGTSESGVDSLFGALASEYRGCRNNYLAVMGDIIECITVDDARFSWEQSKIHTLRAQRDYAVKRLEAVKKNIAVLLKGNHEQRVSVSYGDIAMEIADTLGCNYGGYVCVVEFIHREALLLRAFLHHGFGRLTSAAKDSVQARANIMAGLKNKLSPLFAGAALMAMGHTHQLLAVPPDPGLQIVLRKGKVSAAYRARDADATADHTAVVVPADDRWYVNTGSFLRTYLDGGDGYAEMRGLRPVEIGYAVAAVRGGRIQKVYLETV